ncbi:hypothetical protein L596_001558 [Steinernema carpocapsae]|uniref:Uncharacterized protein n=1 Tax=Steinernema carpocapsae TaxID=34508 RepID=A0A4U8UQJ3_STECR|nr:hypothetical protein L596_001558 [Steinernema carpocapsae]
MAQKKSFRSLVANDRSVSLTHNLKPTGRSPRDLPKRPVSDSGSCARGVRAWVSCGKSFFGAILYMTAVVLQDVVRGTRVTIVRYNRMFYCS